MSDDLRRSLEKALGLGSLDRFGSRKTHRLPEHRQRRFRELDTAAEIEEAGSRLPIEVAVDRLKRGLEQ